MTSSSSPDGMLRIAQIGCGYWGINLLRCFLQNPRVSLVGVAELSQKRIGDLAKRYPAIPATSEHRELINGPADAVVIATPAANHFELAKECLLKDKHVFVEKPIALNVRDAEELVRLAEGRNLRLMVGHTFEYNAAVRMLRNYLEKGEVGEVYYLYGARLNLGRVQSDINAMWSLAPHDLSILLYILQKMPVAVAARGFSFLQPGIEDIVFMILDFPGDVHAHIHVSWLDPNKARLLTVVGSEKMIVYDDTSLDAKIRIFDKGITRNAVDQSLGEYDSFEKFQLILRAGDVAVPHFIFPEPLQVECDHFVECIEKRQTPLTDGRDGLHVVNILEAAQQSLKSGGEKVNIPW
ncbi:MAG: Gfo/Idh/MocA family oxidoreductase [Candidatus Aminicenantes bacterium]|nr:Gfo/Idh/MocA family oxidoreductase [Candidatus Aminicenantes bacterium]